MPDNNSSLKDFNTSAKRREAELRFQHDIIGVPANKKELSRIAKDVELGEPGLSNNYQREMVTTVQTLEGMNLPGKEFAAAVGEQLQEILNIYTSNPASEDDTPQEQAALRTIHRRLITYARKRSTIGSRARKSTTGLVQKARGSLSDTLGDTQNILGKALSALIRPRENRKIERQREVAAAAMGSSQSAFGVHSPRKVTGDDGGSDWGGGFGGDSGLGGGLGGDGGLGGGAVLTRLVNIEDILHEIWQLADASNTRGEEEAENARQAEEARARDAEQAGPEEKDTSPERVGKEEGEEKATSWLGALGGILLTVFTTLTGGIFKGFGGVLTTGLKMMGKALLKSLGTLGNVVWSGMKGLGRLLMGPIGSLVKSVGGMVLRLGTLGARIIAGIFTGLPGLFAAGGAIVGGWLAGIGLLVNEAVESAQIKKVYKDEADTRLATQEAAALGIERGSKSTELLAMQAADKLLQTEGGTKQFQEAMEMADLDIDDIREKGFTAEQSQKLFRARSEQRGIEDEKRRFYEEAGHEEGELVTERSWLGFGESKTYRRGISDADAKARNWARTMRDGVVPVGGGPRVKATDSEHFDHEEMGRIRGQTTTERLGATLGGPEAPEPDPSSLSPARLSAMEWTKKHEGEEYVPYKDTLGNWTVGYGHLLGGPDWGGDKNKVYTQAEIDKFFDEDFGSHAEAARNIPGFEDLDPVQQGALEELSFNMGPAWYKKFPKMMAALERGDTATATEELLESRWKGQVGENRSSNIANRLQFGQGDQAPMFAGGVPPTPPPTLDAGAGGGVNIVISNDDHSVLNSSENVSVIARAPDPQDQDRIEAV